MWLPRERSRSHSCDVRPDVTPPVHVHSRSNVVLLSTDNEERQHGRQLRYAHAVCDEIENASELDAAVEYERDGD